MLSFKTYAIQEKFIAKLVNCKVNFTRKTDIALIASSFMRYRCLYMYRTAKLDSAYGLVQFWLSSEFFSSNYFQIGQHVVLLPINYIASKERRQARVRECPKAFSLRFAQHATGQTLKPNFLCFFEYSCSDYSPSSRVNQ